MDSVCLAADASLGVVETWWIRLEEIGHWRSENEGSIQCSFSSPLSSSCKQLPVYTPTARMRHLTQSKNNASGQDGPKSLT